MKKLRERGSSTFIPLVGLALAVLSLSIVMSRVNSSRNIPPYVSSSITDDGTYSVAADGRVLVNRAMTLEKLPDGQRGCSFFYVAQDGLPFVYPDQDVDNLFCDDAEIWHVKGKWYLNIKQKKLRLTQLTGHATVPSYGVRVYIVRE